jgi:hypothetical protein
MANMMSKSKYEKSTELDGFKNGLHGIGSEPGPNFAGYHKMGRRIGLGRLTCRSFAVARH